MAKPVRILYYSTWCDGVMDAKEYLTDALSKRDLASRVSDRKNPDLIRLARLDCDWDAECLRCFSQMQHERVEFLPAMIISPLGWVDLLKRGLNKGEQTWLIMIGQRPATIDSGIVQVLEIFTKMGGKVFYWAFDEASRQMKCFNAIAPYLNVLIHDEDPIEPSASSLLSGCKVVHHSWVANIVPFSIPFQEEVESKIVFLGSRLGMTPNRHKQIETLQNHFKDRFQPYFDHSIPVSERASFSKIKVHLCPEGRMFTTPGMSKTHTDRPFWSGCMGQVPVVENSSSGDRLNELHQENVIYRYRHGDLSDLIQACEKALEIPDRQRKRIYDYFNEKETVGPIAARLVAGF